MQHPANSSFPATDPGGLDWRKYSIFRPHPLRWSCLVARQWLLSMPGLVGRCGRRVSGSKGFTLPEGLARIHYVFSKALRPVVVARRRLAHGQTQVRQFGVDRLLDEGCFDRECPDLLI